MYLSSVVQMAKRTAKVCTTQSRSVTLFALALITLAAGFIIFRHMTVKSSPTKGLDKYLSRPWQEDFNDGISNCERTDKSYSLIFFHMNTCPHCIEMRPVWSQFKKELPASPYATVLCVADISAENDRLLEKYSVQSFPTVLLVKNNKNDAFSPVQFEGKRTVEGLMEFLARNIV
jgi:thiol-disulfide isomerase/thioredoxin